MTGINNLDPQRGIGGIAALDDDNNNLAVNRQPQQAQAQAQVQNQARNVHIAVDNNGIPVPPSIDQFRKCRVIDDKLSGAQHNPLQQISLKELYDLASDYAVSSGAGGDGRKYIFKDATDSRTLDRFVNDKTKEMVARLCFADNSPESARLRNDLEELLDRIMTAGYESDEAATIKDKLERLVGDIGARVGNGDELARKAQDLLGEVRERYCRIIDNQQQIARLLNQTGAGDKISFKTPADTIGIGAMLPEDEESVSNMFSLPGVSGDRIALEIESGNCSYEQLLERHPEYSSALSQYSQNRLDGYTRKLDEIDEACADADLARKASELRTAREAGQADDTGFFKTVLTSLKDLSGIMTNSLRELSPNDRQKLSDSGRISGKVNELLDLIRQSYPHDLPGLDARIAFLKGNHAALNGLLDAVGYSETIFSKMVADDDVLNVLSSLADETRTPEQLRGDLASLSSFFRACETGSGMGMLQSIVSSLPAEGRSEAQKTALEHMCASLEVTSDAAACINYVLHGDENAHYAETFSLEELKSAYHRLCNPDRDLKAFLKRSGGEVSLRTAEQLVLRAAYHLYVAENCERPERIAEFRDNADFRAFMGIVAGQDNPAARQVSVSRYDGFDPVTVNIDNTQMSTFLFNFNLLMSKSGFLQGAERIPAVHLTKRLSEAVGVDINAILDANPQLRASYERQDTPKKLLAWFQEHQTDLAAGLQNSRQADFQSISHQAEVLKEANRSLLRNELTLLRSMMNTTGSVGSVSSSEEISTDDALRIGQKVSASAGLATLMTTISMLGAGTVPALPGGGYHGLTAGDFQDLSRIPHITATLRDVPIEEKSGENYKFAVLALAKMVSARAGNVTNPQNIMSCRVNDNLLRGLLVSLRIPDHVGDAGGNRFVVMEESLSDRIHNFCLSAGSMTAADRADILSHISLPKDFFKPENNIFIADEDAGKAAMKKFSSAIAEAVKALRRPHANQGQIFSRLLQNICTREQLGAAGTILALSAYRDGQAELPNVNAHLMNQVKSLFRKDRRFNASLESLQLGFNALHFEHAQASGRAMRDFATFRRNSDVAVESIYNVPYTQYALNKVIRQVAYNTGFKTRADMTYAIASGDSRGGKTSAAMVNECIEGIRSQLNCSRDIAEKLIQRYLKTDIQMKPLSGPTAGQTIRRVFRKFAHSKVGSFFGKVGAYLVNRHHSGATIAQTNAAVRAEDAALQRQKAVAESILLSMDSDTTLSYTNEKQFKLSAGVKVGPKGAVGIEGGFAIKAGSEFEISRDDNRFTFVMSAAIGAELEASVDIGFVKGAASVNGQYQPVYSVSFDGLDKATEFLSRVLQSSVRVSDLRDSSDIEKRTNLSAGGEANVEADVLQSLEKAGVKGVENSESSPLTVNANFGIGGSITRSRVYGTQTRTFVTNKTGFSKVGFSASFSPRKLVLNEGKMFGKDVDDMSEDEKKRFMDSTDRLDVIDSFVHLATDRKKAFGEWIATPAVEQFYERKYGREDELAWQEMDDFQKYQFDKGRFFAEAVASAVTDNVVNGAIDDADSFLSFVASKIPVISDTKEFIEDTKKSLTEMAGNLISSFNTSNFRMSGNLSLGADSTNAISLEAGATYSFDETRSYDTNLLNNELKKVEMSYKIEPETSGDANNIRNNNLKFISSAMKKLNFSEEQIAQVTKKLRSIQDSSVIKEMEIVMNGRKESLVKIMERVSREKRAGNSDSGSIISSGVSGMKNEDFVPGKIVFTVTENLSSSSVSIGGGAFVKVGVSSNETVNQNKTYEVVF